MILLKISLVSNKKEGIHEGFPLLLSDYGYAFLRFSSMIPAAPATNIKLIQAPI